MKNTVLSIDILVADLLARWPETAPVFIARRMGCVGCAMNRFETISEVATTYHLSPSAFLEDLRESLKGEKP